MFALLSMAIIVWRAVTTLSQAQNEFESRETTMNCPDAAYGQSLYVLVLDVRAQHSRSTEYYAKLRTLHRVATGLH